jgi:hypothetical protein
MPISITPDECRVLELIAAEPTGYPEQLLVARGFSLKILAGLVRSGLASVSVENPDSGPDTVFRLWITERGRRALRDASN